MKLCIPFLGIFVAFAILDLTTAHKGKHVVLTRYGKSAGQRKINIISDASKKLGKYNKKVPLYSLSKKQNPVYAPRNAVKYDIKPPVYIPLKGKRQGYKTLTAISYGGPRKKYGPLRIYSRNGFKKRQPIKSALEKSKSVGKNALGGRIARVSHGQGTSQRGIGQSGFEINGFQNGLSVGAGSGSGGFHGELNLGGDRGAVELRDFGGGSRTVGFQNGIGVALGAMGAELRFSGPSFAIAAAGGVGIEGGLPNALAVRGDLNSLHGPVGFGGLAEQAGDFALELGDRLPGGGFTLEN